MPDLLTLVLLAFAALIIIGPRRLPESLEALMLAVTDFQRTQRGEPPLGSLYNARRYWISINSNLYAGIQILYQVSVHLDELRKRSFYVLIAFGIGLGVAFYFAQPLLGYIIRPIHIIQPLTTTTSLPIANYLLTQDIPVTTNAINASGTFSQTLIIPKGTILPLTLTTTTPVVLKPTEIFATYFQIALIVGIGAALPVALWQVIMFLRGPKNEYGAMSKAEWDKARATLSPEELVEAESMRRDVYEGLTADEIRPAYFLTPLALVLFICGVLFTYFIILPSALDFLFGIGGDLVQPLPSLEEYVGFALTLILWVGLAFETPLIMFFLARFNVVTARQFAKQWRYAIVLIVVIAAVITPTVDVFNMSLVALPMLGLYVLGIGFAWVARPSPKPAATTVIKTTP